MTEDLKLIKKLYGEDMMHFCRDNFSTILEENGVLSRILQNIFAPSHTLYDDLINKNKLQDFKNYIYKKFYKKTNKKENLLNVPSAYELMRRAGYTLYECKTEKDIQSFKKYYADGEELCTFKGKRLKSCYVFFAVKDNVDNIKRENFKMPKRQDEYGTSVISIQFTRDNFHTLSIKNRYNHYVNNPDATFSNNLDNIIFGLTEAFEQTYGLKQKFANNDFEIPGYIRTNDGVLYKYNLEINNIYYGSDNIILNTGQKYSFEKEKYLIMDYFILDLKAKKIYLFDDNLKDSFPQVIGKIKRIIILKTDVGKEVIVINNKNERIKIKLNMNNQIVELKSDDISQIFNNFLHNNETLKLIEMPEVCKIGDSFLYYNHELSVLNMPKLQIVGSGFLCNNCKLKSLNLPMLTRVENSFLYYNIELSILNLPNLQQVGQYFLMDNLLLDSLDLPMLEEVGNDFLYNNRTLTNLKLPKLRRTGDGFLSHDDILKKVDLPMLEEVGNSFLLFNSSLININLPNLQYADDMFLYWNLKLVDLKLPKLKRVGNNFLYYNESLVNLELPYLEQVGDDFLASNESLTSLEVPVLQQIGDRYLANNSQMKKKIKEQLSPVYRGWCKILKKCMGQRI